ncbi:MAG: exodeoxyribonuclease III [Gammaproteobacteria bacterium]|nr:MAG: exodeoxyribonuclease III [Gammaproteobacteria bacterium]UTW42555.1 exodeoxyribonuclease III [bacterium SCSIO 12844]
MRIITFNANGIRAAARKGFFDWFEKQNADFLCIQETKAQRDQLDDPIYHPKGYYNYFFDAEKKGYSGVAIYSRIKPKNVITGLDIHWADTEGRYIQLDFENFSIASLYLPSGSSKDERQVIKMQFLEKYQSILEQQINDKDNMIICGDINIVHKEIDIKNFKSNQKNSGCLPEERAWLDYVFDEIGWVDAFRVVNTEKDQYTWWSNRGQARANNVGWRIDYQWTTPNLKSKIVDACVYKQQWFSDHAPLTLDYQFDVN